jgi:hypothetical protein
MNIYINNGEGIPSDDTCYIVGKNGIYLKKTLDLIESLTPVDKISFLEDVPTFAKMKIPKLPTKLFGNILGFFRDVYKLYSSESIVLLYYNKEEKVYKVFVPEQEVTGASLSYKSNQTMKNHLLVGSIHSHASMSAFHSGTDVHDEEKFDGLHITIGKVNDKDFFDICGSIAVNGMRVAIDPIEYVLGLEHREYTSFFPNMFRPGFDEINGIKIYKKEVKSSTGYILNASEEDFKYPDSWLKKVSKKEIQVHYGATNYGYGYGYNSSKNPYAGLFSKKRYVIRDGKLVEVSEDPKQTTLDEYQKLINNKKDLESTKKCVCSECIFRHDKLTLQDIKEVEEESLENCFMSDTNWWNEGFGE